MSRSVRNDEWHDVGCVGVDSGRILIADPVYAGELAEELDGVVSGDLTQEVVGGVARVPLGIQLHVLDDGLYPVQVRCSGGRLAEVRLVLDPWGDE